MLSKLEIFLLTKLSAVINGGGITNNPTSIIEYMLKLGLPSDVSIKIYFLYINNPSDDYSSVTNPDRSGNPLITLIGNIIKNYDNIEYIEDAVSHIDGFIDRTKYQILSNDDYGPDYGMIGLVFNSDSLTIQFNSYYDASDILGISDDDEYFVSRAMGGYYNYDCDDLYPPDEEEYIYSYINDENAELVKRLALLHNMNKISSDSYDLSSNGYEVSKFLSGVVKSYGSMLRDIVNEIACMITEGGLKSIRDSMGGCFPYEILASGRWYSFDVPYADLFIKISESVTIISLSGILENHDGINKSTCSFSEAYYDPDLSDYKPEFRDINNIFNEYLSDAIEKIEDSIDTTTDHGNIYDLLDKLGFKDRSYSDRDKVIDIVQIDYENRRILIDYSSNKTGNTRRYNVDYDKISDYITTPLLFERKRLK